MTTETLESVETPLPFSQEEFDTAVATAREEAEIRAKDAEIAELKTKVRRIKHAPALQAPTVPLLEELRQRESQRCVEVGITFGKHVQLLLIDYYETGTDDWAKDNRLSSEQAAELRDQLLKR